MSLGATARRALRSEKSSAFSGGHYKLGMQRNNLACGDDREDDECDHRHQALHRDRHQGPAVPRPPGCTAAPIRCRPWLGVWWPRDSCPSWVVAPRLRASTDARQTCTRCVALREGGAGAFADSDLDVD